MLLRFILFATILMMSVSTFAQNSPLLEKGVSQELAKWRAENYSDVRYKLNLTIEKKAPTLKGTVEIRVKVGKKGGNPTVMEGAKTRTPIILDWRKIKGHEHLSKIKNVSINGKNLILNPEQPSPPRIQPPMYSHYFEHLIFEDSVKKGENIIKLDFESPILTSGGAVTRYIDKEDGAEYIYSLFVPSDASTAFPVFDQPDLKARFDLIVDAPRGWNVISNTMVSRVRKCAMAKPIFSFEETKPISTYVFAFAAGGFEEFDEKGGNPTVMEGAKNSKVGEKSAPLFTRGFPPSKIYVRKSQAEKFKPHAKEIFRLNRESIKYFEEYFDYKFPFPKYDLVLIPEFPFGGMEHAGATFLRESSIIFPTEPTANNYISRATLLFHENAHQWFGDTVTMKWFDDLWLKEGFATFMAYKALEKIMPEYNAWKVFYERTKQRAYLTDVTKGTTPIYQKIPNLNSAKSAYGNIVYNKAPSFLKQAEFYLGEDKFQTAVRAFLKDHEFKNAEWSDLVKAFEKSSGTDLKNWADVWVKKRGLPIIRLKTSSYHSYQKLGQPHDTALNYSLQQKDVNNEDGTWLMKTNVFLKFKNGNSEIKEVILRKEKRKPKYGFARYWIDIQSNPNFKSNLPILVIPNYQDYGYGIFLLDEKSKKYILKHIQNEKDDFLRSMMWGSLWDSVRFSELAPQEYMELAMKNIGVEKDVSTISSILGRVNTAFTYYLSESQQKEIAPKLEKLLIEKIQTAKTKGERITFYRAFLGIASSDKAKAFLKKLLEGRNPRVNKGEESAPSITVGFLPIRNPRVNKGEEDLPNESAPSITVGFLPIKTKDRFDIVTRLIVVGDEDARKLLANLEKTEKGDAAKRYAYAAKAGFATKENKAKYWNDFVHSKEISESWIEAAFKVWNSPSHSGLTLPYLEKALAELPNHKQNRKIFFVNGWVASFIGGQKSEVALQKVNRFLKDNPDLDIDLQRKILERLDGLERAVKIREKYGKSN